ncbi:hypothetical protein B0O99DRAFT_630950 [Bisporella sp. PMI_857]|nr:hypothetical protein B0O99DRAFT_630950 [Bisporella sp. PMI_857]
MNEAHTPVSIQYAPSTRRRHTKVRTGCGICKKRKIKCDEQKPSCRNCIKYSIKCDFPINPSVPGSQDGDQDQDQHGPSQTDFSIPLALPMTLNPVHLELLHNYTTLTSYSLSNDMALRNMWRLNVPQLGFSVGYVLRGVLALSALHMSRLCPHKHDFYLCIAISEHESALQTATPLLRNVTAQNCSALYIFSLMTFFYTVASPKKSGDMVLTNNTGMADWLRIFRGMRHISDAAIDELLTGPFGGLLIRGQSRIERQSDLSTLRSTTWLSTTEHQQLTGLRELVSTTVINPRSLAIYMQNIETLEACFCRHSPNSRSANTSIRDGASSPESLLVPETSNVLSWPYQACSEYIELLIQGQPEALVIFAYYCVLLKSLDGCWWMQGWPSHLIREIWDLLGEPHRLWIHWPMEEIGWRPLV